MFAWTTFGAGESIREKTVQRASLCALPKRRTRPLRPLDLRDQLLGTSSYCQLQGVLAELAISLSN
jgi:hypothetical protein